MPKHQRDCCTIDVVKVDENPKPRQCALLIDSNRGPRAFCKRSPSGHQPRQDLRDPSQYL